MPNVLVAYISRTGMTEKMAELIAEGVRMAGHSVDVKKITSIKNEGDLAGYDGYVFGCPTYHRDMTAGMKTFLFVAQKANLTGKIGGAFCSYTHSGESGPMILRHHAARLQDGYRGPGCAESKRTCHPNSGRHQSLSRLWQGTGGEIR